MQKEQLHIAVYLIFGLVIGICLDIILYQKISYIFPYFWLSVFGLTTSLTLDFRHNLRIIFSCAVLAALVSSPFLFLNFVNGNYYDMSVNLGESFLFFPISVMVIHSFNFAYHLDNCKSINYTNLFYAVWNTITMLLVAIIFCLASKLLILLTVAIFDSFNFKLIPQFLSKNIHFNIIFYIMTFIIGIGIGRQNLVILDNLRFVILKLFYYLYPPFSVISILYLVLFALQLLQSKSTSNFTFGFLLILTILGIIFFNAVFQDGESNPYKSKILQMFLRVYRFMILPLSLLTFAYLHEYIKNELNTYICLVILIFYGFFYAYSVFLKEDASTRVIRSTNISLSFLFLVSYLIINNPIYPLFWNN